MEAVPPGRRLVEQVQILQALECGAGDGKVGREQRRGCARVEVRAGDQPKHPVRAPDRLVQRGVGQVEGCGDSERLVVGSVEDRGALLA
ncbi:hypothetical protein [Jiangella sp. DSM 45060]|uniref:hypothetical protein n=1 Tax=Jiangella sp. DSM 45060 TaxID=1798224 RepID=UPI001E602768|nr:hypothetical protein [Jiangella sp. DSM 45060]